MRIEARGRMIRKPRVSVTYSTTHATIRVDDASNPEFWLDLVVPFTDLGRLIQGVEDACKEARKLEKQLDAASPGSASDPADSDAPAELFQNPPGQCPRCGAQLFRTPRGVLRCPLCPTRR